MQIDRRTLFVAWLGLVNDRTHNITILRNRGMTALFRVHFPLTDWYGVGEHIIRYSHWQAASWPGSHDYFYLSHVTDGN
jgi:hypothetical protein